MKLKMLLFAVLMLGTYSLYGQKPMDEDPYLLWKTTEGYSGFVIHPNGNIIANRGAEIFELDGNTGQVIKTFPVFLDNQINAMDVSKDGKLLGAGHGTILFYDLENDTVIGSLVQNGNARFAFFPDNKRFITSLAANRDSNLAIYNFETKETTIFGSITHSVWALATSPDGKYFATGGLRREEDIIDGEVYYTILTLWDAETLQPIKELAKIGGDFEVRSIKFSPDGKYVGVIVGSYNLYIYRLNDFNLYKHYNDMFENLGFIGIFCFLGNDLIVIKSRENGAGKPIKLSFINTNVDMCFNTISNLSGGAYSIVEKNPLHNSLIDADGQIDSYDLNKILTSIHEPINQMEISVQYIKDSLILSGLNSISGQINITISDISGKVIRKLNVPVTNSELRIPLILPNGTYLIHVQDGNNEFTSKFLVTE